MSGSTPGRGAGAQAQVRQPPRRLLLGGAGAAALAAAATLSGCGLRLDLPEPPPPVPTRRPAPDEDFLLGVIAQLRGLLKAADGLAPRGDDRSVLRATTAVQRRQVTVLTGRLTNVGVPTAEIAAAKAPGPGRVDSVDDLAGALAAIGPDQWQALAAATEGTRDLVLAAWASRLASAVLLGEAVEPLAQPSGARPRVIEQTSPLVYGFEVVAAQSVGRRRTRAVETLDALRRLDLAVSGPTTSSPGGWALPFPVTTPAEAQRLAGHVLGTAVDALVDVAGPSPDAAALDDTARWSGRVQVLATDWGMPLVPFPGAST